MRYNISCWHSSYVEFVLSHLAKLEKCVRFTIISLVSNIVE